MEEINFRDPYKIENKDRFDMISNSYKRKKRKLFSFNLKNKNSKKDLSGGEALVLKI
jgi:hypothetical protein